MVPEPHRSGSHLARAACSSSSFLASCILSSAICACSSAIWSCRSLESPSSFRRVFSNSCLCFSSRRRRSDGDGDVLSYTSNRNSKNIVYTEKAKLFEQQLLSYQYNPPVHYSVKSYTCNCPHILSLKHIWAISLYFIFQISFPPFTVINSASTMPVTPNTHTGINMH